MSIYIVIVIAFILVYGFTMYNSLIQSSNIVKEAFSTMDVYLKKRWDLIPNLVEVVKSYAEYEKTTLEELTTLRTKSYESMSNSEKINTNINVMDKINQIIAIAEKYPELKANENFLQLNSDLSQIEDEIANSRKYYNGAVRILNNKIEMFPSNIVAKLFKFEKQNMFEIEEEQRENVKI